MIIAIASGKGGTGKTTIAVSLALSIAKDVQFLDCDVEEPNAHLFLNPDIKECAPVYTPVPKIDQSKCNLCGKCSEVCAYNALAVLKDKVLVFPHLCHGCGGCSLLCPQGAITETGKEIGVFERGTSGTIDFMHGRLNIGEVMAPPLIRNVKSHIDPEMTVIIDSPPGTSCPVVEAVKRSDFCILVTEPTPFGFNDLVLAVETLKSLHINCGVVINRDGIGDSQVEDYCRKENIPVLMRIPFRKEIAFAYSRGTPLVVAFPAYKKDFLTMFEGIGHGKSG